MSKKIEIEIPEGKELVFNSKRNCYELVDTQITMDVIYDYFGISTDTINDLDLTLSISAFAYWKLQLIAKFFNKRPVDSDKDVLYRPWFKVVNGHYAGVGYFSANFTPGISNATVGLSICYLREEDVKKSVELFPRIWENFIMGDL